MRNRIGEGPREAKVVIKEVKKGRKIISSIFYVLIPT